MPIPIQDLSTVDLDGPQPIPFAIPPPPAQPRHLVLNRFVLYETKTRFFIVGTDAPAGSRFRVLKIDRTTAPDELVITEDEAVYTKNEVDDLLEMIAQGNRATGGMREVTKFYGIVGFVRFTEGYYLVVVTKRSPVALIGGHYVFHIDAVSTLSIHSSTTPTTKLDKNSDEARYLQMFQSVDLTKNFYFSYSYDITRTLQWNMTRQRSEGRNKMFVWNQYLLENGFGKQGQMESQWALPIMYGFVDQSKLSIMGRNAYVTLIARRSRHFAGARFLKRGVNDRGYVANDVESEQIVSEMSTTSFCGAGTGKVSPNHTSFVQHRGSIPLNWTQDGTNMSPKPAIELSVVDPFFTAAALHFDDMFKRYGAPCIVLNLIKAKEKTARESILLKEFSDCIEYLNQFLPEEKKIQHIKWDMSRASKSPNENVISVLEIIADKTFARTGFFHSGADQGLHNQKRRTDNSLHLQNGVVRTNCIDCLDRTNAAQFIIAKCALGHQLYSLGLIAEPFVPFDCDAVNMLTEMYHDHGDTIALQYGGSHLVNTMETYRKINQWTSHSRDMIESIRRFYSNSFVDAEKQDSMNLFLGNYIVRSGQPALWELPGDHHLHNTMDPKIRSIRKSYISWWTPESLIPQENLAHNRLLGTHDGQSYHDITQDGVESDQNDLHDLSHSPVPDQPMQEKEESDVGKDMHSRSRFADGVTPGDLGQVFPWKKTTRNSRGENTALNSDDPYDRHNIEISSSSSQSSLTQSATTGTEAGSVSDSVSTDQQKQPSESNDAAQNPSTEDRPSPGVEGGNPVESTASVHSLCSPTPKEFSDSTGVFEGTKSGPVLTATTESDRAGTPSEIALIKDVDIESNPIMDDELSSDRIPDTLYQEPIWDDYWDEYYRPKVQTSFQRLFAYGMNSTGRINQPNVKNSADHSPFEVRLGHSINSQAELNTRKDDKSERSPMLSWLGLSSGSSNSSKNNAFPQTGPSGAKTLPLNAGRKKGGPVSIEDVYASNVKDARSSRLSIASFPHSSNVEGFDEDYMSFNGSLGSSNEKASRFGPQRAYPSKVHLKSYTPRSKDEEFELTKNVSTNIPRYAIHDVNYMPTTNLAHPSDLFPDHKVESPGAKDSPLEAGPKGKSAIEELVRKSLHPEVPGLETKEYKRYTQQFKSIKFDSVSSRGARVEEWSDRAAAGQSVPSSLRRSDSQMDSFMGQQERSPAVTLKGAPGVKTQQDPRQRRHLGERHFEEESDDTHGQPHPPMGAQATGFDGVGMSSTESDPSVYAMRATNPSNMANGTGGMMNGSTAAPGDHSIDFETVAGHDGSLLPDPPIFLAPIQTTIKQLSESELFLYNAHVELPKLTLYTVGQTSSNPYWGASSGSRARYDAYLGWIQKGRYGNMHTGGSSSATTGLPNPPVKRGSTGQYVVVGRAGGGGGGGSGGGGSEGHDEKTNGGETVMATGTSTAMGTIGEATHPTPLGPAPPYHQRRHFVRSNTMEYPMLRSMH